jgi:hypothetical protein
MRFFYLLGILALLIVALIACGSGDASLPRSETELPEVVQAALESPPQQQMAEVPEVIRVVAPLSTDEPARERPNRSYPAPTGAAGFRKYYQMRCYPGCHSYPATYGQSEAPTAQPTATPTVGRERPNRSYPAPTGAPGFRKYYQMRCYPGCHSYPAAYGESTPEPTKVHP